MLSVGTEQKVALAVDSPQKVGELERVMSIYVIQTRAQVCLTLKSVFIVV